MSPSLDDLPGGAITLSNDLRILTANRMMATLAGRAAGGLIGESLDVLLSAPSRILFQTHVYPALRAEGRVEEVFLTLASDDGEPVPVLFNAARAADGSGYDGLIVRILARTKWEKDLLAATKAIATEQAASQRLADDLATAAGDLAARHAQEQRDREFRDAFIGVISHELRTPITTIYGMSHVLRERFESMPTESVREHLGDIELEADRLRRLTEDLLVLSRAEGGRLDLSIDPIVIGHVVDAAVANERDRSPDHHFAIETSPSLPLVLGEDLYVGQILRNFLSNAAKYSPPGTTVRVATTTENDGVAVRVIDAGPGFSDQDPGRLFELFYRTPAAIRKKAGAGIGLFVCRELAIAMGGHVWAKPCANPSGAEFGVWLPQAEAPDED